MWPFSFNHVGSPQRSAVMCLLILYFSCIFTASSTPVVHSAKVPTHLSFVARSLPLWVFAARTQNIARQLRNPGVLCRRLSDRIAWRFLCGDRLRPSAWCRTVRCPPSSKRFFSQIHRFSSLARSLTVVVRACFVKLFFVFQPKNPGTLL